MKTKSSLSYASVALVALAIIGLLAACAPAAVPTPTATPKPAAAALTTAAPTPTAAPKPPPATPTPAEPIKIGFLSHAGAPSMDPFYVALEKSVRMAEEDINAKGGVLGRKIQVIIAADQLKADQTAINVERLITRDKVVALIGPAVFANVEVAVDLAEKYQVPDVLELAAVPETTQKGRKYTFRQGTQSAQKAQGPLEYLKSVDPKPKTIALVHENRSYGAGMVDPFKKLAADMGFQIAAIEPYDSTALDFKPTLLRLKAQNPDAVVVAGYLNDAIILSKQAKEVGLNPKYLIGAGGWATEDALKGAGDAMNGTYALHEWVPNKDYPGSVEYTQRYTKDMGKWPDFQASTGYGAVYTVVEAIKIAGSTDGPKLQEALTRLDFVGPFGRIKFNEQHDNVGRELVIGQVKAGKWVGVWPAKFVGTTFP